MAYYLPGAEPIFYRGDSTGCLLLHGLASSPGEMRWLAGHLAEQGYTVCAARLAGHGTDRRDLKRIRWADWYGSVLDAYHILRQQCDKVVITGHSTGGLLALHTATELPVDGLVILASPLRYSRRTILTAQLARRILPYMYAPDRSDLETLVREEQLRRGEAVRGRARYDYWAVRAVTEFFQLAASARADLAQVTAPVCLIYARQDEVASMGDMALIATEIGSTQVETHTLELGGHNVMMDVERETVFRLVARFIEQQVRVEPAP